MDDELESVDEHDEEEDIEEQPDSMSFGNQNINQLDVQS